MFRNIPIDGPYRPRIPRHPARELIKWIAAAGLVLLVPGLGEGPMIGDERDVVRPQDDFGITERRARLQRFEREGRRVQPLTARELVWAVAVCLGALFMIAVYGGWL